MIKEYIITALKKLQQNSTIHTILYENGVNLVDYEAKTELVSMVEEAIATMLCNNDEKQFELMLADVQWFLYENVTKIIWVDNIANNVETPELFVEFMYRHYEIK